MNNFLKRQKAYRKGYCRYMVSLEGYSEEKILEIGPV